MKKFVFLTVTLLLIIAFGVPVFAATNIDIQDSNFIKDMFNNHRQQLNLALEKGQIAQDEADVWNQHFDYMQKYHEQNGFSGCHGNYNINDTDKV